jgi:hypothetical protein
MKVSDGKARNQSLDTYEVVADTITIQYHEQFGTQSVGLKCPLVELENRQDEDDSFE